jgi:hypothetical protein
MSVLEKSLALRKATLTPEEVEQRQNIATEVVRSLLERLEIKP